MSGVVCRFTTVFYPCIAFWVMSGAHICSRSSIPETFLSLLIKLLVMLFPCWQAVHVIKCYPSYILSVLSFVQEMYDYTHIPGQAVLHHGRHRHGARATSSGLRINLLLWCRRYTRLSLFHFYCWFLSALNSVYICRFHIPSNTPFSFDSPIWKTQIFTNGNPICYWHGPVKKMD